MKANLNSTQRQFIRFKVPSSKQRAYWAAIGLASMACGTLASAQTTNAPATPPVPGGGTNVTKLQETTVIGKLDTARSQIVPDLGGTVYVQSAAQIESGSQGDNAPVNQLILRAPGVAQDSAANGDLHVRGEHANLQYRINDVLLPEGITGFGLELDPRFIESLKFITGSLPAQYGFRTAGVVDITTKSGAFENAATGEIYGGSHDTFRPSFEIGGSTNNLNYFVDGSYEHNSLGIENPTPNHEAIHDKTDQGKGFAYLSYVLDDTSRVNLMLSASYSKFEVPNTPGQPVGTDPSGANWNDTTVNPMTPLPANFESSNLNERQREQNYYAVVSYQKAAGDLNFQVSAIARNSEVHFMPDPVGDLYFNGVASDVDRNLISGGVQGDASYQLGENHTIRFGGILLDEQVRANSTSTVFNIDPGTMAATGAPYAITDNNNVRGLFAGLYVQDEWKIFKSLTLNFGLRYDNFSSSFDNEDQVSPRVNLIYQPTDSTALHVGYAHYFTPPPIENVGAGTVSKFDNTSNASATDQDNPVKAERADYFDAGATQKLDMLVPGLQAGVDAYYKEARNQLDDGLFGQTLILSAFNYSRGIVYGTEFTFNYAHAGFSSYANIAYSVAKGRDWNSAQFLFDPTDANYVRTHYIALDHDQTVSGSFGASYLFNESKRHGTRFYVDAIYGTGLRTDGTAADGSNIPNGATVPSYYTVNCGAEQIFNISSKQVLKARVDIVNITDSITELRDGSGVGVNAAQYAARLGFFGSVSYSF